MSSRTDEREFDLQIARRQLIADGVIALEMRDPRGADLPAWSPGAHIDVCLPSGLMRQYSLCGEPGDRSTWRIAVLREPAGRGGSAWIHTDLREGMTVTARGPRNHFDLVPSARYLFIGGGIGITPLIPMMASATEAGADWLLHYGGRTRGSMAFTEPLVETYDSRVHLHPQDEVGLLDLQQILGAPQAGVLVYCCGPEPLLQAVEQHCSQWPEGSLRVERFTPKHTEAPRRHESFEVELARSGMTLTVPPDRSVIDVLAEAGVRVLNSCREGTCGSCETTVLKGEVDHRDSLLTAAERASNDTIFVCVSRAAGSRLVLDL